MNHTLPKTSVLAAILAGLLAAAPVSAQVDEPPPGGTLLTNDAPPPALPRDDQEGIEPEVTIVRQRDRTIEEYRVNGQLYMIKVTPSKGYPYYLVDADGDGNLETRRNELDPRILLPSWVIFRW
ncbi:MAG: DUF2782 domain-containing protein [Gammaproteobacteria bacterium]